MPAYMLSPGAVIEGRFQIEQLVNSGGMGVVYRARDLRVASGPMAFVALKLLRVDANIAGHGERFIREANLLSGMHHPGIVSYVADGKLADGQHYLAMEWLDGEDLGRRLQRGPLPPQDALMVLERLADILSLMHSRGVIHRDLKPTNLFLPGGHLDQIKVLDFGIARVLNASGGMTQTGLIVGTPAYMAPEQARGLREITPAADIYSLGCIVYECLTGRPPFLDDQAGTMLVRVLFETPPPIETLCPGLPGALIDLVQRMIAKAPEQRLRDGLALSTALRDLRQLPEVIKRLPDAPAAIVSPVDNSWLSRTQQSLLCVALATPPLHGGDAGDSDVLSTDKLESLQTELRSLGTTVEPLVNGTLLITVGDIGSAADRAGIGARAALTVKRLWPQAVVSLATGRGSCQAQEVLGDVVSRAARLSLQTWPTGWIESPDSGVLADEVSAHLLLGRFAQQRQPGLDGILLQHEEERAAPSRPLFASATPNMGREVELNFLQTQLAGCIENNKACVILVTAAPGLGKSRLRHEFQLSSEQSTPLLTVLSTQGDLRDGGVPYSLVRRLILSLHDPRSAASDCAVDDPSRRPFSPALRDRLSRWLPPQQRDMVTTFLLQLFDVPVDSSDSALADLVSSARKDRRRMHEHLSRAFVSWLAAECAHAPVVLTLDDLHWGDPLSISLVDDALRDLRDAPLFVLTLALPEIRKVFPKLWMGQPVQELPLKPLSRRACERLIRHVLGPDVRAEKTARMIEQSTGNPFFLEELMYAEQSGETEAAQQTILAMLQARIGRIDASPRRVLLAASIYGLRFQRSGLLTMLGTRPNDAQLDQDLGTLIRAELIEQLTPRSDVDDRFYAFRGPLLREAAYQLLSVNALLVGHRMAARFLERSGHADPLHLAEHFKKGREPEKASLFFLHAAIQQAQAIDASGADALFLEAKQQLVGLPDSASRQRLLIDILLHQVRFGLRSERQNESLAQLDEAQMLLLGLEDHEETDSTDAARRAWIEQLSGRLCLMEGRVAEGMLYCRRVLPVAESLQDEPLQATASQLLCMALIMQGRLIEAQPHVDRALRMLPRLDHVLQRVSTHSFASLSLLVQGHSQAGLQRHDSAVSCGSPENPASTTLAGLLHCTALALCADSAATLRGAQQTLTQAERLGSPLFLYVLHSLIAWAHARHGDIDPARASFESAQAAAQLSSARMLFGDWLDALNADTLLCCGATEKALRSVENNLPRWRQEQHQLALGLGEQVVGMATSMLDPDHSQPADVHFERARSLMKQHGQVLPAARLCIEWAHVCQRRGAHEQAAALVTEAQAALTAAGWSHIELAIQETCLRLLPLTPSEAAPSSTSLDTPWRR